MKFFYIAQCVNRGQDPGYKQRPSDSINFAVYDLAERCLMTTYIIVRSVQAVINPGKIPVYRPGHCGQRDTRTKWSSKTPREKFQDDKLALLEAFPDIMAMTMLTSQLPLAEDELLRGFREMATGKAIPLWLVFAVQCFLDAQYELHRDLSRAHADLNMVATHIKENVKFHENLRIEN